MNAKTDKPFLEIIEQPTDMFRFRYKSEMHGKHGMLTGRKKKTCPAVSLHNFTGEALIRCSLYQILKPGHELPFPHSHRLVVHCGNDNSRKDPHEVMVSQLHGYKATFKGMEIMITKKKDIEVELYEKLVDRAEFETGRKLTKLEKDTLRSTAKKNSNGMNLDRVSLCFEAYERVNGKWIRFCEPIFSTPINSSESPFFGELKICRMSSFSGSASGNDDLFIFVEKVDKKNIEVRFFEQDDNQIIWEDWGKFTEADVYHQYAIALKTPPYRETNIDESVKVYIQLYRPHDQAKSKPTEFRYKPCNGNLNINRKRARVASSYDSGMPLVAGENAFVSQALANHVPQRHTDIEQMIDISDLLNEALSPEVFSLLLNDTDESDMLAKDSVSFNDDYSHSLLSKEEKWIEQFLHKIDSLITGNKVSKKICGEFFKIIFHKMLFSGNSMLHICVKSDDLRQMNCLWKLLHTFQLYDFLHIRNFNKQTCVHFASAVNKPNVLEELVKFGADVNAIDAGGNTGLHVAIQEKNDDCVAVMLNTVLNKWGKEIIINLSARNDNGYTALHLACITNNVNIVRMLHTKATQVKNSIFDDVDGKHGNNALHIAIESDAQCVAEYLIQNKCIDPLKVNKSNHTAFYLAHAAKSIDFVNLMQHYMLTDNEHYIDDDSDASSKYSFESQQMDKTTIETKQTNVIVKTESDKLQPRQDGMKWGEHCFPELCSIFNKNEKWKSIAMILGYQDFVESWIKSRNPSKVLFTYAQSLNVSKDMFVDIFIQLGEKRAVNCVRENTGFSDVSASQHSS